MVATAGTKPIPLTAEQVHRFIADGFLVLQPSVPEDLHRTICRKLAEAIPGTDNPGNNVLPLVPEMRHVLQSPEVHGALLTLLGAGYLEHPHRYCHVQTQQDLAASAHAAKLAANSHQDSYTPLGRPRQHHIRFLRVMYYPQDTPQELGPTHVIPGTHLNRGLSDADKAQQLPVSGPAGMVSLTHFDIGHAAGVNVTAQRRFMVKFIFMRSAAPHGNGWSGPEWTWRGPRQLCTDDRQELAWSHLWDWLRAAPHRYASFSSGAQAPANGSADVARSDGLERRLAAGADADRVAAAEALARLGAAAVPAIPALVACLNREPDPVRIAATYALGAIGAPAIPALTDALRDSGAALPHLLGAVGHGNHGGTWREQALVMDDAAHALAAIGPAAIPALIDLLAADDEWARVNAAFALGELDHAACDAVPALVSALADESHFVVRTAADALGTIGAAQAAAPLGELLHRERPGWETPLVRGWSIGDQVRFNAATALARLGSGAAGAEADLIAALDDPCGQVTTVALAALRRLNTPAAVDAAFSMLTAERWDPSLTGTNRF